MLTLYVKTGCPYCITVIDALEELRLEVNYKNLEDEGVAEELIARGGKRQVPYLVDDAHRVEMYESEDIIAYLHEKYGTPRAPFPASDS